MGRRYAQVARAAGVRAIAEDEWRMIPFHCSNYVPGVVGGK